METFEHPFYDIEIEALDEHGGLHLIKILSIDGRRFTYQLTGTLNAEAVDYVKTVIDAACFGDMLIVRDGSNFSITEAPRRLKKHS